MNANINHNTERNGIEISFEGKPSAEIRDELKAAGFRWHNARRVWYAKDTEQRREIAERLTEGRKAESEPETAHTAKQTKRAATDQNRVRIYYNGIKVDGELIRCHYSLDNHCDLAKCVTIYGAGYADELPCDLLPVKNDSDAYTDYFEKDRATISDDHPLYKYFRFAAVRAAMRDAKLTITHTKKRLANPSSWDARHPNDARERIAAEEKRIAEYEKVTDPGQPTAADLDEIKRRAEEAQRAKEEAEQAERAEQERYYNTIAVNGYALILTAQDQHPLQDDAPAVLIHWSEHPAFFRNFADDELKLSVPAAEIILKTLDEWQNAAKQRDGFGGYYKTSFSILGNYDGEAINYDGRYDLGDGDGGLIKHIWSWGEWNRTHDSHGNEKAEPDETNDIITFAEWLATFAA